MLSIANTLGMILGSNGFTQGYEANRAGAAMSDNPYRLAGSLKSEWDFGWRVADRTHAANENRKLPSDHPELSAFELGKMAAMRGLGATSNPYHFGSPFHTEWRLGWAKRRAS